MYDVTYEVVSFPSWPPQPSPPHLSSMIAVAVVVAASARAATKACMFFMVKVSGRRWCAADIKVLEELNEWKTSVVGLYRRCYVGFGEEEKREDLRWTKGLQNIGMPLPVVSWYLPLDLQNVLDQPPLPHDGSMQPTAQESQGVIRGDLPEVCGRRQMLQPSS